MLRLSKPLCGPECAVSADDPCQRGLQPGNSADALLVDEDLRHLTALLKERKAIRFVVDRHLLERAPTTIARAK